MTEHASLDKQEKKKKESNQNTIPREKILEDSIVILLKKGIHNLIFFII